MRPADAILKYGHHFVARFDNRLSTVKDIQDFLSLLTFQEYVGAPHTSTRKEHTIFFDGEESKERKKTISGLRDLTRKVKAEFLRNLPDAVHAIENYFNDPRTQKRFHSVNDTFVLVNFTDQVNHKPIEVRITINLEMMASFVMRNYDIWLSLKDQMLKKSIDGHDNLQSGSIKLISGRNEVLFDRDTELGSTCYFASDEGSKGILIRAYKLESVAFDTNRPTYVAQYLYKHEDGEVMELNRSYDGEYHHTAINHYDVLAYNDSLDILRQEVKAILKKSAKQILATRVISP